MKERPIIFSDDMVHAILDGKKTQTRRVIKPQPATFLTKASPLYYSPIENKYYFNLSDKDGKRVKTVYPRYNKGDRLWVRESFCLIDWTDDRGETIKNKPIYKADNPGRDLYREEVDKWISPIFMPRRASRITLEIMDIRVERVQDISTTDCCKEGIQSPVVSSESGEVFEMKFWYKTLWDKINAKRGYPWGSNDRV